MRKIGSKVGVTPKLTELTEQEITEGNYGRDEAGADFLCYVTPGEHLKLPDVDDVKQGVIATRIAAHAADIAKGLPRAMEWDNAMSAARKELNWEEQIRLAIDPEHARKLREQTKPHEDDVCSMCGEYCAIKMVDKALNRN